MEPQLTHSKTILLIIQTSPESLGTPTGYVDHYCFGNETQNNMVFQANFNLLLLNLSFEAADRAFYNATNFLGAPTIYALYLCRGHVAQNVCQNCVASSTQFLNQTCSSHRQALVWNENCMVRYSDHNIFS